jgi:hypothetical protein
MKKKWVRMASAALLMFAFGACDSLDELTDLEVVNENNPDRERALSEAGDIESLIGSAFNIAYDAQFSYDGSAMALSAAADETSISWGNTGLQQLSSEPRVAWPNSTSWNYRNVSEFPWYGNYEALSAVYDALVGIEEDPTLCNAFDCERAQAFAKFVQGLALGWMALQYDSAFIFDETVDLDSDILELQPYPAVMTAALGYFDAALAAPGSWTLPSGWISGNPLTKAEFQQLVHSWRARWMYLLPRTPAERASIDWAGLISHIDQGLTEDFTIEGDGDILWNHDMVWSGEYSTSTTWARADYKTIGWTEISEGTGTGYANWLATPVADRDEFELNVPDARIMPQNPRDPQGEGLDFLYKGPSQFPSTRGTYHYSFYSHHRYDECPINGMQCELPIFNYDAQQLMKAEALFKTGDPAGAAAIVNVTRVGRADMPAATAGDADLLDKLIYEYRMEIFDICPGCAYFTRRGWGSLAPTGPSHHQGLVEGSLLHFAIPGKELEILQKLNYTYGGVGNEGASLAAAAGAAGSTGTTVPARLIYAFNDLDTPGEKLDYIWRGRKTNVSRGVMNLVRH